MIRVLLTRSSSWMKPSLSIIRSRRYSLLSSTSLPRKSSNRMSSPLYISNKQKLINTNIRGISTSTSTTTKTTKGISDSASELTMVKAMLGYLWPSGQSDMRARVIIALSLLVGSKLLNVQVPFIFKHAVDHLTGLSGSGENVAAATQAMATIGDGALTVVSALLLGYGAARVGASLFHELRNAIFAKVAQRSIRRLARQVFLHLHSLDLDFHLSRQTGGLSRAIDRGTRGISSVLTSVLFNVVPTIFEISLVCGILTYKFGGAYAGVVLGCVGTYGAFTLGITQWRTNFRVAMNKADNEAGARAVDSLINYEAVKYYGNEGFEAQRYDESLQLYEKASLKTASSLALLNWGQAAITSTALAAIMVMAGRGVMDGSMSVGDLVLVNGMLMQIALPLGFLGSIYRDTRQSLIDMKHVFGILSIESRLSGDATMPKLVLNKRQGGSITFDDIRFTYPNVRQIEDAIDDMRAYELLKGISFTVPAGHKVGIVGSSGSGKSTILRLLFRFYSLEHGQITIDGQDISKVQSGSLREHIGVIPQDVTLFNESIFYNIHYGRRGATAEEVFEAARLAHIHDVIMGMPQGYKTQVGERGLKLSGGEKQRIAIARAILKNPPILLCDEATSALDSDTEGNILASLKALSANRTSIFVAHRLSTVVDSNEILVLEKGRLAERGTHASLLKNPNGIYTKLWRTQQIANESKNRETYGKKII